MPLRDIQSGTTSGTIGTETLHNHALGVVPDFVAITPKGVGIVYLTSKTTTQIGVKGSAASLPFDYIVSVDHSLIK